MLFNSFHFFLFFPIVTLLYFLIPHKFRWALLLAASCYFYMVLRPVYILILAFTIVIDYVAGIQIEKSEGKRRKYYLIASLIANIGVLFFFKYFNFFNENISALFSLYNDTNTFSALDIILPIGLSFHTFQAMSYTIEVYRGNQKAEKHFGIYALYVMFYPQLVAGPIERPQNVIHQFHEVHKPDYIKIASGLRLMAWGFFKKMVVADHLGMYVDKVYASPADFHGFPSLLAVLFFSFQIYCDFSGYSDIALGSARVMGFSLMKNFNMPYFSKSIQEFWSRWHISLSTWFRDYLYIPLGGNRTGVYRWYFNLFIVFLLSGLWHGASWTFVIWGALHGIYLIFAILKKKYLKELPQGKGFDFMHVMMVFGLVTFGWIFFRSPNMHDTWLMMSGCFKGYDFAHPGLTTFIVNRFNFTVCIVSLLLLIAIEYLQLKHNFYTRFLKLNPIYRFSGYTILLYLIIVFGVFNNEKFIYFQF